MSLLSFRSPLPSEKFVHFHNKFVIKPLTLINYSILRSHYHYYLTTLVGKLNKHDLSFNHDKNDFSFIQTKRFSSSSMNKVNENGKDSKLYSDTLLLPKTNFPLRADAVNREIFFQDRCTKDLYQWQVRM